MVGATDNVDPEQIAHLWLVRYGHKPVPFTYESVADGYNGDDWLMQNMARVAHSILRGENVWKNRESHRFGFGYVQRVFGGTLAIKVRMDNLTQLVHVLVKELDNGDS